MKNIEIKIRLVFLPLLFLALIFIASYSFLYWLLNIQFDVLPWREDINQFFIPIGAAGIAVLVVIRRRVHLLKLDKDDGKIRTLYYLIAAGICVTPTVFLIKYLDTATGKLTQLNSITEIKEKPSTRYYFPKSYVLNKEYIGVQSASSYSGKNNNTLNYDIYIALPFTDHLFDTAQSPPAFLSIHYHTSTSAGIADEERDEEWDKFREQSFERFDKELVNFEYLELMPNKDERTYLIKAAKKSALYVPGSPVSILAPIKEPFHARNGNKLQYAFLSFSIGLAVWFVFILIPGVHVGKAKQFSTTGKGTVQNEFEKVYELFKPRPGFIVTPLLIMVNLLVFIIMVWTGMGLINFDSVELITWGALYQPRIQGGEWWRLGTAMFLHGGVMHVLMNMISLYVTGIFLEQILGTKKFLAGYLVAGIIAGIISIWWHDRPIVGVGASGAIFGLYGILLSFIISKVFDPTMNKVLLILLGATAGYSLIMGFISKGIDNSAHIGGLIAGLLIGFLYVRSMVNAAAFARAR